MTKAIYVDDEHDDNYTTKIKELLEESKVDCELRNPPLDLAEVDEWELDLFIIDFDLASALVDGKHIGYRGNTLATELRNKEPFCPIVLVSRRNIIRENSPHLTTDRSDVDLIIFKNDIPGNEKKISEQILALTDGYKQLAELKEQENQPWSLVLDKLGAREDERMKLREAFPPIDEERSDKKRHHDKKCRRDKQCRRDKKHHWYIPTTIEWIRTVILGYPGILYDSLHASARIGITMDAFISETLQEYFAEAEYKGLLAGFGKRWWADRLVRKAKQAMLEAAVDGPVSDGFAQAYERITGEVIESARCLVDGEPIADQICYVYEEPVKRQNSILYYPDSRPPIMDAARASIKAIKESNRFDEDLVDANSYEVVQEIWGLD